jgi:RHS repeat-associated protein
MLADLERARHPASSPSRRSRPAGCCCGGSGSRRGLQAARRALRRGSECRKSLHTPGSSCIPIRDRGRQNIFEQINNNTGAVTYLHHDQAGSTRLLTGSTGKVEGSYTYTPYGAVQEHTGTATTLLGYDAQYTSSDTGLIYMRARVYDPATAQFLTVDPEVGTTRAPYTYAGDNPLNEADPSGRESLLGEIGHFLEPLNPVKYYEEEIESYENGCGYFASVAHGLEGAVVGVLDASGAGEEGAAAEGAVEGSTAIEDTLAGLTPGNSPGVYTVDSPEELQQVYDELSAGGKPTGSSYPGQEVELSNGTRVGIRETSKTGGPAVDINTGSARYRIHVAE